MTEAEAEIGNRLKQFREYLRLSQVQFAAEIGLSRDMLAGIEYGRVPLRYDVAKRVGAQFDLNEAWLAFGVGNPMGRIERAEELESNIPVKSLFSQAFEKRIWPHVRAVQKDVIKLGGFKGVKVIFTPAGLPPERQSEWLLFHDLRAAIKAIPVQQRTQFTEAVMAAVRQFFRAHNLKSSPQQLSGRILPPANIERQSLNRLTKTAISNSPEEVQDMWPTLKNELQKATAKTGKSSLAAFLKVDLTRVSQWLTDADSQREPGAEYALQMQEWLRRNKTIKKSPGSGTNTAGAKTRKKGNREESKRSSPPER